MYLKNLSPDRRKHLRITTAKESCPGWLVAQLTMLASDDEFFAAIDELGANALDPESGVNALTWISRWNGYPPDRVPFDRISILVERGAALRNSDRRSEFPDTPMIRMAITYPGGEVPMLLEIGDVDDTRFAGVSARDAHEVIAALSTEFPAGIAVFESVAIFVDKVCARGGMTRVRREYRPVSFTSMRAPAVPAATAPPIPEKTPAPVASSPSSSQLTPADFAPLRGLHGQSPDSHWATLLARSSPNEIADALVSAKLTSSKCDSDFFHSPPKGEPGSLVIARLKNHTWSFVLPAGEPTSEWARQLSALLKSRTILVGFEDTAGADYAQIFEDGKLAEDWENSGDDFRFQSSLRNVEVTADTTARDYLDEMLKHHDALLLPTMIEWDGPIELGEFFMKENVESIAYVILKNPAGR